jgi:hypothetical protein
VRRIVVIVALMVLGLTGCVPAEPVSPIPEPRTRAEWTAALAGAWAPDAESAATRAEPVLVLDADGLWEQVGGCPLMDGSWLVVSGGGLYTTNSGYERGQSPMCADFAPGWFFAAATSVVLRGDALTLIGPDGDAMVTLHPTTLPSPGPAPTSHSPNPWAGPDSIAGEWTDGSSTITFFENGTVSGQLSCRHVRGRWSGSPGGPVVSAYSTYDECDGLFLPVAWTDYAVTRTGDAVAIIAGYEYEFALDRAG